MPRERPKEIAKKTKKKKKKAGPGFWLSSVWLHEELTVGRQGGDVAWGLEEGD